MTIDRKQYVIIVTGHPASGKTTLAKKLQGTLMFPLIYKDQIKEILYDILGWSDREWSKKLGLASHELLFYVLESHLSCGNSVIVESNFDPSVTNNRFEDLKINYNCKLIQVYCHSSPEVLLQRYSDRGKGTGRHPGHFGDEILDEYQERLERVPVIKLETDTIIVYDTTLFSEVREREIIERVLQVVK